MLFQGGSATFQMSYSRGHGLCEYPKSSVSQCSGDPSRLVFRYQACADIRRSESSVEEMVCMGSWKEGSTHYFLGKKKGSRHPSLTNYTNFPKFLRLVEPQPRDFLRLGGSIPLLRLPKDLRRLPHQPERRGQVQPLLGQGGRQDNDAQER